MSEPIDMDGAENERTSGTRLTGSRSTRGSRRDDSVRNVVEWVAVIVVAILLAVLIKTFVVQAFRIPSASMEPTLMVGDRVVVNKLSYRMHDVNRGDVIVFKRPPRAPSGPNEPKQLIKRVIGLPGDTVLARDGKVYINDKLLNEPYLPAGTMTLDMDNPLIVPKGQLWVMGDNRTHSGDSRVFGTIDKDTIIGRAFFIIWPPGRMTAL